MGATYIGDCRFTHPKIITKEEYEAEYGKKYISTPSEARYEKRKHEGEMRLIEARTSKD